MMTGATGAATNGVHVPVAQSQTEQEELETRRLRAKRHAAIFGVAAKKPNNIAAGTAPVTSGPTACGATGAMRPTGTAGAIIACPVGPTGTAVRGTVGGNSTGAARQIEPQPERSAAAGTAVAQQQAAKDDLVKQSVVDRCETTANARFMAGVVPWPTNGEPGYINLHYTVPNRAGMSGRAFKDLKSFMGFAEWATPHMKDIYFCLTRQASAETGENGKQKAVRNKKNATHVKAIWIDADVKPDQADNNYTTTAALLSALEKFLADATLAAPSAIVSSGSGGLHIYWISNRVLTIDEWRLYAEGLKALITKHGFKCDVGLTTDAARVLRVPGTFNRKHDPEKPVVLLRLGDSYDFEKSLTTLATIGSAQVKPPLTRNGPQPQAFDLSRFSGKMAPMFAEKLDARNDNLAEGINTYDDRPLNPDQIFHNCPHFQDAAITHGKGYSQGLWMLDVLAATFMEDGRRWAHYFSKGYATYSDTETDKMYERKAADRAQLGLGWPGCDAFENTGCKQCTTCPFRGKIKSPLNLCTPAAPPNQGQVVGQVEEGNTIARPDAEGTYHVGNLSYRMMSDITQTEIDWLWPNRIASGKLTLIAGAPDDGKSQIVVNIAATISNGGAWPFEEGEAEQGAVIWLSAEDTSADITVPRLIAAGANRSLIADLNSIASVKGGRCW